MRRTLGVAAGAAVLLGTPMSASAAQSAADSREDGPERYRQALAAFFDGDDKTAAARFELLAEDGPGHELAREYLAEAGELQPRRGPATTDPPLPPAATTAALTTAALATAALATAGAVVVRRRRPGRVSGGSTGTVPAQRTPGSTPADAPRFTTR